MRKHSETRILALQTYKVKCLHGNNDCTTKFLTLNFRIYMLKILYTSLNVVVTLSTKDGYIGVMLLVD